MSRSRSARELRDQRRAEIVAAARRIVAESGLEALTFGALEKRLAFTRGVVTYHFKSKDEIVRAVFTSAIDEIDAAVRAEVLAAASIEERVRAVLRANVRGFVDRAEAGRVLLSFWGRITADAQVRRLNAALYARYRASAAKLLKRARAAREIAAVDADTTAALLVGIVLGIATQQYFEPGAIDVDAAVELATRAVVAHLATKRGAAKAG
jgi:AcrR family transcriptional regulator